MQKVLEYLKEPAYLYNYTFYFFTNIYIIVHYYTFVSYRFRLFCAIFLQGDPKHYYFYFKFVDPLTVFLLKLPLVNMKSKIFLIALKFQKNPKNIYLSICENESIR